jgi:hypothetical protein
MKQISEVEEKPFTSSLNICPCRNLLLQYKGVMADGMTLPPLTHSFLPVDPGIFNLKTT